jgi:transcriptional regulator of arginine metabolism
MHARRETLRRIINGSPVSRQQDLVRLLGKAGYHATQSSVSRDLRELGVAKRGDRYVLPDESPALDDFATVARFVRGIKTAGANLAVIRTLSGDDTIFVATAGAATQRRLLIRLHDKLRA